MSLVALLVFLLSPNQAAGQGTPIPGRPRPIVPLPVPSGPILPRPMFPVGVSSVRDLLSGDLDRDGDVDVVLGGTDTSGGGVVSVLRADGAAGFAAPVLLPTASGPLTTHLADLDGDGDLDLALVTFQGSGYVLETRLGDGAGGFAAALFHSATTIQGWLRSADLDLDGRIDLIGIGATDIVILFGDGAGGFSAPASVPVGANLGSLTLADVNGDRRLDLLTREFQFPSTTTLHVLLGRGGASFDPPSSMALTGFPVSEPELADLDHDGDLDLVLIEGQSGGAALVTILDGDGAGGFVAQSSIAEPAADLALTDLNGDGELDLVVSGAELLVHSGDGAGGFLAPVAYVGQVNAGQFALLDMDGDGALDVFTEHGVRFPGDDAGGFLPLPVFPLVSNAWSICKGDFDGDGALDLATAHIKDASGVVTNKVSVLLASGPAAFAPAVAYTVGKGPQQIVTVDANGDGFLDLATANDDSNNVSIREGDGHGGFPTHVQLSVVRDPLSLAFGDLNADGWCDLVTASANSGGTSYRISIRLATGSGGFAPASSFAASNDPWGIALGDMNEDGKLDLVTEGWISLDVGLQFGDGVGGFGPAVFYPGGGTLLVGLDDVDEDGHLDVYTCAGSSLRLRRGDGLGALLPAQLLPVATQGIPDAISIGDLDGDGTKDFLCGANWLAGDGAGGYRPAVSFSPGGACLLGDFTGDGRPDLACAAKAGVVLHENLLSRPRTVEPYGAGTPGCQGTLRLGVSGPPRLGSAAFGFTCSGAPPRARGLLILGAGQDLAGSDSLGLGVLLHVDVVSSPFVTLPMSSDASGFGFAPAPLPTSSSALGLAFYAQAAWVEPVTQHCSSSPRRLVSSSGLALRLLP